MRSVSAGESELLPVPGVTFVGELPDNLQYITRFAGAVTVSADHPQEAESKALLTYLASPAQGDHPPPLCGVKRAAAPVSQKGYCSIISFSSSAAT